MKKIIFAILAVCTLGCSDDDIDAQPGEDQATRTGMMMPPPWANTVSPSTDTPQSPGQVGPNQGGSEQTDQTENVNSERPAEPTTSTYGGSPDHEFDSVGGHSIDTSPADDSAGMSDSSPQPNLGGFVVGGAPDAFAGSDAENQESGGEVGGAPDMQNMGGMFDDAAPGGMPLARPEPSIVNCDLISTANRRWEVCDVQEDQCAGVFTDGSGCERYCAAAGLVCVARFGGQEGCGISRNQPIPCDARNGHNSDWCVCGRAEHGTTIADAPHKDESEESCDD